MAFPRRKNRFSTFSLSFLDIMFCGFGAVVLLVLIVNSQMVHHRKKKGMTLQKDVNRLEAEVLAERRLLQEIKNSLEQTEAYIASAEKHSALIAEKIKKTRLKISRFSSNSLASRKAIEKLQSDLKAKDAARRRLLAEKKMDQEAGEKARHFSGPGHRQYLTGLRLGGKRTLILLDASASMLDSTIVGVIRKRNLSEGHKKNAPKWQRAIRTTRWLLANLPTDSTVRLAVFNNEITFLGESGKTWIPVTNRAQVDNMVAQLLRTIPAHGTNLFKAFDAAVRINPKPDNILLLTDGLPTLGKKRSSKTKVSSEQRERFFRQAVLRLSSAIPVNTILFPLEGDPLAAGLFWKLAVETRGSFLTPSRDWP